MAAAHLLFQTSTFLTYLVTIYHYTTSVFIQNVLVVVSNGVWAVKLCFKKIFKFLTTGNDMEIP